MLHEQFVHLTPERVALAFATGSVPLSPGGSGLFLLASGTRA